MSGWKKYLLKLLVVAMLAAIVGLIYNAHYNPCRNATGDDLVHCCVNNHERLLGQFDCIHGGP